MLEDIIKLFKDVSLRHKKVSTFKYQNSILINAQGNNKSFQVVVDDNSMHQLLISYSPNIFTSTFDIYIIGFVSTDDDILNIQSQAYDIAIQLLGKIERMDEYKGIIEIHDYSIMTLSHFTDDDSAGVKLSVEIRVPVGLCDIDEYFDDDMDIDEEIKEINPDKDIELKPIRLPINEIKNCGC